MSYCLKVIDPHERHKRFCYCCGLPADIVLVADYPDRETGHVEEINLCIGCFDTMNKLKEQTNDYSI